MKRFDACGAPYEEGCLADYEEAHQIEVDRDIKAANLQLLVDAVLAVETALDNLEQNLNVALEDRLNDAVQVAGATMVDLARGLKQ